MPETNAGERRLERPLLKWLKTKGWLRDDTIVSRELPWMGSESGPRDPYPLWAHDRLRTQDSR